MKQQQNNNNKNSGINFSDIEEIDPLLDNIIQWMDALSIGRFDGVNCGIHTYLHEPHGGQSIYAQAKAQAKAAEAKAQENLKNFKSSRDSKFQFLGRIISETKSDDPTSVEILNRSLQLILKYCPNVLNKTDYHENTLIHLLAARNLARPLQTVLDYAPAPLAADGLGSPPPEIRREFTKNANQEFPSDLTNDANIRQILENATENATNNGWRVNTGIYQNRNVAPPGAPPRRTIVAAHQNPQAQATTDIFGGPSRSLSRQFELNFGCESQNTAVHPQTSATTEAIEAGMSPPRSTRETDAMQAGMSPPPSPRANNWQQFRTPSRSPSPNGDVNEREGSSERCDSPPAAKRIRER